jgi:hypothetical protein
MTAKLYLFYLHFKSALILIKYILVRLNFVSVSVDQHTELSKAFPSGR